MVKNPPANAGDIRDVGSIPGSGRFPWKRRWQPTPVFLLEESHEQKSLAGYDPSGHKELNTTWGWSGELSPRLRRDREDSPQKPNRSENND